MNQDGPMEDGPYELSSYEEKAEAMRVEVAYSHGKQIQVRKRGDFRICGNYWFDCEQPVFNWKWYIYRIKEEAQMPAVIKPMSLRDLDPVAYNILDNIKTVDQAQYSTKDQLRVLLDFANKLGLCDAADALRNNFLGR
jgi:hypothetical protein